MTATLAAPLVLASASPRRKELFELLDVPVSVIPSRFDESTLATLEPSAYVRTAARRKTEEVMGRAPAGAFVLGADTIVTVDRAMLGKPAHDADARTMLSSLMGRAHEVWTGICLARAGRVLGTKAVSTQVVFRHASDEEVRKYVATGEGRDKAGAYAVQGRAAGFVEHLQGSYSNVVGLPVAETLLMLREHGALLSWP